MSAERGLYRTDTEAADEMLQLLFPDLTPDDLRTDGGNVNMPKVRSLWRERAAPPSVEPHPGSASLKAAGDAPPLIGNWHHGQGYLVSGTIRIARWDCDTNPPTEFRDRMLDWICSTLNAAVSAHERNVPDEFATPASKDRALSISGAAGPLGEPEILAAESAPVTEMHCWLVEQRRAGRTAYLSHRCGHRHWEPIPDYGTRFSRREDAMEVAACINEDDVFVADHIWG